jgi:heat shock protein HslJ
MGWIGSSRGAFGALALGLLLTACGGGGEIGSAADAMTEEPADPEALVGDWRLLAIELEGEDALTPTDDAEPMLSFSSEADPTGSRRFGGSGGCNRIMGSYDAGRTGRMAIARGPAMTMMACPEPVMSLEQAFVSALETVSAYVIDGDRLSIEFGGGVLRLERVAG